jgi:hypothetical protein
VDENVTNFMETCIKALITNNEPDEPEAMDINFAAKLKNNGSNSTNFH